MKSAIVIYCLLVIATGAVSLLLMEDSIVFLSSIVTGLAALISSPVFLFPARRSRRALAVTLVGLVLCLGGIASIARWHWPLRLSFLASESSLEEMATATRGGESLADKRIGLFRIHRAEVGPHGIVCLWLDLDPAGRTGLVQTSPEDLPFNLWSAISLSDRWQLISED
jgi:hypothetical protein